MTIQKNTGKSIRKFGTNLGQFIGKAKHFDAYFAVKTAISRTQK
ncbi:MAG: hypothetical protein ACK5Z5_04650 [Neisseriaceae bacterium]